MNKQVAFNCVLCFLVGFFLYSILKHGSCGVVEGQTSKVTNDDCKAQESFIGMDFGMDNVFDGCCDKDNTPITLDHLGKNTGPHKLCEHEFGPSG